MVLTTISNGYKVLIGEVTAKFGSIDSVHQTPHSGTDYSCKMFTEIHAPFSGVVSRIADYGNHTGLGKSVFVRVGDKQYVIGHLSSIKTHVGQIIHKGDLLALSGNTGNSTAPHMHFGAFNALGKVIDPCLLNNGHQIPFSSFHAEVADTLLSLITSIPI